MRHVDEGTLHAWLDRQVTDPEEAAWITTHLRECATCSARVAEEEATLRDAESLLASVAPSADASREAFDTLVASARQTGGAHADRVAGPGSSRARTFQRWVTPVSWAATVALAVGLGWIARQMTSSGGTSSPAPIGTVAEHREASSPVPPAASSPAPPSASVPEPAPAQAPAPARAPAPAPASTRAQAPAASSTERPRQARTTAPPVIDEPSALQPPSAPVAVASLAAEPANATGVGTLASGPAVLPPGGGVPAGETANRAGGAGRGGGGGGGRGGRAGAAPLAGAGGGVASGSGTGTGTGTGVVPSVANGFGPLPAVSPPPAAPPGLTVNGFRIDGQPVVEQVDGIAWTTVSRADAAVRSGMALYGLEGLLPVRTMVSADATKVRTVYLLNGAEVVLLQERSSQQPSPAGDPSSWSSVRGDVVLTLRGAGGNAAMLGARIRLD